MDDFQASGCGKHHLACFLNVFGAQSLEDGFCQQGQIRDCQYRRLPESGHVSAAHGTKACRPLEHPYLPRALGGFSQARASCSSTQSEQSSGAQANGKIVPTPGTNMLAMAPPRDNPALAPTAPPMTPPTASPIPVGLGVGRGQSGELRFTPLTAKSATACGGIGVARSSWTANSALFRVAKIPTTLCMAFLNLVLVRSWDAKRSCGVFRNNDRQRATHFLQNGEGAEAARAAHMNRAPAWLGTKLGGNKRSMSGRVANGLRERHPVDVVISYPKML